MLTEAVAVPPNFEQFSVNLDFVRLGGCIGAESVPENFGGQSRFAQLR